MNRTVCLAMLVLLLPGAAAHPPAEPEVQLYTRHLGTGSSRDQACQLARSKVGDSEQLVDDSCQCKLRTSSGGSTYLCFVESASGTARAPSVAADMKAKLKAGIREAIRCRPEQGKPCPPPVNNSSGIRD